MKKIVFALVALLLGGAVADAITIKAYNGDVNFDHVLHRKKFKCDDCHEGPPRHFELNRESAHKLCIGCHKKVNAGPARHCSDCHKAS